MVLILDSDMGVAPEDVPKFVEALVRGKGEMMNGSRMVYPMEGRAMRFLNLLANKAFAWLFSWLLGQQVRDTLCGTKALYREDYERIAANRAYFGDFDPFGDFDLLFGASRLNLRIVDLAVRYHERTYGETNISRFRHGLLLLRMSAVRRPQAEAAVSGRRRPIRGRSAARPSEWWVAAGVRRGRAVAGRFADAVFLGDSSSTATSTCSGTRRWRPSCDAIGAGSWPVWNPSSRSASPCSPTRTHRSSTRSPGSAAHAALDLLHLVLVLHCRRWRGRGPTRSAASWASRARRPRRGAAWMLSGPFLSLAEPLASLRGRGLDAVDVWAGDRALERSGPAGGRLLGSNAGATIVGGSPETPPWRPRWRPRWRCGACRDGGRSHAALVASPGVRRSSRCLRGGSLGRPVAADPRRGAPLRRAEIPPSRASSGPSTRWPAADRASRSSSDRLPLHGAGGPAVRVPGALPRLALLGLSAGALVDGRAATCAARRWAWCAPLSWR